MSQGLYAVTTRAPGTIVTADIYNFEHQTQLINDICAKAGAHSDTIAQMRATTDPFPAGAVTPVTSVAAELEQIRFVINDIKTVLNGGTPPTYWYSTITQPTAALMHSYGARVHDRNSTQSIPNGTLTPLQFTTVDYDTGVGSGSGNAFFNPSQTDPGGHVGTRLTAPVSGVYQIGAYGQWDSAAVLGAALVMSIQVNRAATYAVQGIEADSTVTGRDQSISTQLFLNAGDYAEVFVSQSNGGPLNILVPAFWMELFSSTVVPPAPQTLKSVIPVVGNNGNAGPWSFSTTNIYGTLGDSSTLPPTNAAGTVQKACPIPITLTRMIGHLNTPISSNNQGALRINVNGSGSNALVAAFGKASAPSPSRNTVTGNLSNGVYTYKTALVINGFENDASSISASVTIDATHQQVALLNIATYTVGTTGAVVTRNVYRTQANGSTYFFLTNIANNTTTAITDNIADASLGAAYSQSLYFASAVGQSLAVAQDALVCLEANSFAGGLTTFVADQTSMVYTSAPADGFLTGRANTPTSGASNELAVFGARSTSDTLFTNVSGWLPKIVALGQATLTCDAPPGVGTSFTVNVVQAEGFGVGNQLLVSDLNTASRGNVSGSLVEPGFYDNEAGRGSTSGVSTNMRSWFSYVTASPDVNCSFYCSGRPNFNAGNLGASPVYAGLYGWHVSAGLSVTESGAEIKWPLAGTFKYFGCFGGCDPGTTMALTLRVNGVDSALVLTFTNSGQWQSDLNAQVHVNADDRVVYKFLRTAGSGSTIVFNAVIGFVAD